MLSNLLIRLFLMSILEILFKMTNMVYEIWNLENHVISSMVTINMVTNFYDSSLLQIP